MKQVVCHKDELAPGQMRAAQVGPVKVVVIRANDGSLHALAAKCLHQGGPLERGRLYEYTRPTDDVGRYETEPGRETLKCPWHGYEYDIRTGRTVFDPSRCLQTFATAEEDDHITVELGQPGDQTGSPADGQ